MRSSAACISASAILFALHQPQRRRSENTEHQSQADGEQQGGHDALNVLQGEFGEVAVAQERARERGQHGTRQQRVVELAGVMPETGRVHADAREVDERGDGDAGADKGFLAQARAQQEGRAQGALHAGQSAEESAQHAADGQEPGRKSELAEAFGYFQAREHQQQAADGQLYRRDDGELAEDQVLRDGPHVRQSRQQPRADERSDEGRQAEADQYALVGVSPHQCELEQAIEEVHDARQRDRVFDREEQGECRQQQGAEPEAAEERQTRGQERNEADDDEGHGRCESWCAGHCREER